MHIIATTILICGIFFLLYVVYINTKFSNEKSRYHNKTVKLYLNYQFTIKILKRLKALNAYDKIIHDIKEYFALNEISIFKYDDNKKIIFFSELSNVINKKQGNILSNKVNLLKQPIQDENSSIQFISNNIQNITLALEHHEYVLFTVNSQSKAQDIIIQYLNEDTKLFILYSTQSDNKLSKDDVEMITNIAIPILNIAIMDSTNGGFEKT